MAQDIRRLQSLVDLASEPSGEKRRDLLRGITDIFLEDPEGLSEVESGHMSEIMGQVAYDLEMQVRKDLAERLAAIDAAPHDLIQRLANDEIEVARPVLLKSGVLKESDLLKIVGKQGQEHLEMVSRRETVSEAVADGLVERGNVAVLENLVRNDGARLSRGAIEKVVARSEHDQALQAPLVERKDVPPDLLNEMFWWVSSALRQHIISTTAGIDEKMVDELLAQTGKEVMGGAPRKEPKFAEAEKFIQRKEWLKELNPVLLVQLLRQGRIPEFIVGFAHMADLDSTTAQRVIYDPSGEALAVSCKAIDLDRPTYTNLLLLTDKTGDRSARDVAVLATIYDNITQATALRTMRFWRTRKKARGVAKER